MSSISSCPHCKSSDLKKYGFQLKKQRYLCKQCNRILTENATFHHRPTEDKEQAVKLYLQGLSFRAIARLIGVTHVTVLRWVKSFAQKAEEQGEAIPPQKKDLILIELDEFWHYVGSKKNKLWIWKAFCRDSGQLVGWVCGNRDESALRRLLQKIKSFNPCFYATDNWQSYSTLIPEHSHFIGNRHTVAGEQNNGRQRRWFARFRRKSIVVSKCANMVHLTMVLFARFHVNGVLEDIGKFL